MPPLNPMIMQMLQSLGGQRGPGGPSPMGPGPMGPGGPMPSAGGVPPGMPGPGGPPGGALGALGQEGMDALNGLNNRPPIGELRVERTREGLELIHKIILSLASNAGTDSMELSKQLFTIGRQVADMRVNLNKENEAGLPPESMIGGIQGTGLPGRA